VSEPVTADNAVYALYAKTDEPIGDDGAVLATFVGYFRTRDDMVSYAGEFTGTRLLIFVHLLDGSWLYLG
jgi:hypothetical protein